MNGKGWVLHDFVCSSTLDVMTVKNGRLRYSSDVWGKSYRIAYCVGLVGLLVWIAFSWMMSMWVGWELPILALVLCVGLFLGPATVTRVEVDSGGFWIKKFGPEVHVPFTQVESIYQEAALRFPHSGIIYIEFKQPCALGKRVSFLAYIELRHGAVEHPAVEQLRKLVRDAKPR